jgi:hypothetical protein
MITIAKAARFGVPRSVTGCTTMLVPCANWNIIDMSTRL